jgi:carboxymethylenebutenolidase
MGKMIELIATDGFRLSAYRAEPEGDPRGGVVVAQEIFGVNSTSRASATDLPRMDTS